ncbi:glycosyltransferase [Bacillus thuringiensis]|uniref:Glycosyl transferase family 1 n=1 Tax=Bacillus thuringiensis subsp. higo TaxID=132266 RepID=A0A9X6QU97_BACUH|nr:glycosyltransferase [Bacillus thuringiensis]MED2785260.1 glycosyltransferase [Bacillus thuringiensis]MED2807221.1 glycosyltransferase [Bacillus thuringiensis]MED2825584.1 glycosyltransferase [Bacillus thuringiensis]MED2831698.1 glycosyltransferase [Bacillus thuringiensis]MED2847660.1 glycosyltransferase [Bacillus thuringiensis]
MKILHISLGLPPYRTGGLTKYATDLMFQQSSEHKVFLLYPGKITISKKIAIKKNKPFGNIGVYELVNPLPIPLLNGINQPQSFMKKVDRGIYEAYLKQINPDIIHVHTLMGIHKEFFEAAKDLSIKLVFTTHDYFGLCPKVNLMDAEGNICEDFNFGHNCLSCNVNALSFPMIYVMQSYPYRYLKDSSIVKSLREFKKKQVKKSIGVPIISEDAIKLDDNLATQYVELRRYYLEIFKILDYFHFNSYVAKEQFESFLDVKGKVISISHKDISDYRQERLYEKKNSSILRFGYLGPVDVYKGFYNLKDTLDFLKKNGYENWHLSVYGGFINDPETYNPKNYTFYGRYEYSQLKEMFNGIDLLIIPSIWKETFGFIGLEAQSYGVPIMVSENVGFKDLIEDGETGFIYKTDGNDFANKLSLILDNPSVLAKINENILKMKFPFIMKKHTDEILNLYQEVRAGVEE